MEPSRKSDLRTPIQVRLDVSAEAGTMRLVRHEVFVVANVTKNASWSKDWIASLEGKKQVSI